MFVILKSLEKYVYIFVYSAVHITLHTDHLNPILSRYPILISTKSVN